MRGILEAARADFEEQLNAKIVSHQKDLSELAESVQRTLQEKVDDPMYGSVYGPIYGPVSERPVEEEERWTWTLTLTSTLALMEG